MSVYLFLENEIDGSTLTDLTNDVDEFKAVLAKSGHRLKVKKVLRLTREMEKEAHCDVKTIAGNSTKQLDQTSGKENFVSYNLMF